MNNIDPLSINLILNEIYNDHKYELKYMFLRYCKENNYEKVMEYLRNGNPLIYEIDDEGNTGFHIACFYGYENIVELFITYHSLNLDLNSVNLKGYDGFMLACYAGNLNIVKLLIKNVEEIKKEFPSLFTNTNIITNSLSNGYYNKIKNKNFRNKIIDFNKKDFSGKNSFIWACYNNRISIVRYLVNFDFINVNMFDDDDVNSFYYSCMFNHIEIVKLLINNRKIDVNIINKKNNPLLFVVCVLVYENEIDIEVLDILLKNDRIESNITNNKNENIFKFCIRLFEYWGRIDYDIISLILNDDRIEVNNTYYDPHLDKDQNINTPLMLACMTRDLALVNLLIDYNKIDVNKKVPNGDNIIYRAFQNVYKYNDIKILSLLLNCNCVELNNNPGGVSILLLALPKGPNCIIGDKILYSGVGTDEIFKMLLQNDRVDVNKEFKIKNRIYTTLLFLCYNSDIDMIKLLINNPKTNVNCLDEEGNNAFIIACIDKNIDLIKLLHRSRINIHHKNDQGYGALYYAITNNNNKLLCMSNKLHYERNKNKNFIIKLLIIYGLTLNDKEFNEVDEDSINLIDTFPRSMEFFTMRNKILNDIKNNT